MKRRPMGMKKYLRDHNSDFDLETAYWDGMWEPTSDKEDASDGAVINSIDFS